MKRFLNDACQINCLLQWMKYGGFTFSPPPSLFLITYSFFFVRNFSPSFFLLFIIALYHCVWILFYIENANAYSSTHKNSKNFKSNSVKFIDGLQNPKIRSSRFPEKNINFWHRTTAFHSIQIVNFMQYIWMQRQSNRKIREHSDQILL